MKIDSISVNSNGEPRRLKRPAPPPAPDADQQRADEVRDAIKLSDGGERILKMRPSDPERAALIARLRDEVGGGTYKPDPEAIARRMAERLAP